MKTKEHSLLEPWIFGEVVLDCFEDGTRVLGGAPFNVAWHLQNFGLQPLLITAIGDDDMATYVSQSMSSIGMDPSATQSIKQYPTGHVNVHFSDGEPHYDIVNDVAYDHIDKTRLPQPEGPILLYNGTLALRQQASKAALASLLDAGNVTRFVDVNLRDPWWNAEETLELLRFANYVKLNEEELRLLTKALPDNSFSAIESNFNTAALEFKNALEIVNLIITLGSNGALVIDAQGEIVQVPAPPRNEKFVNSVGAGDALSAVMILSITLGWELQPSLERAQEFASFIVTQQGATCSEPSIYQDFLSFWGLGSGVSLST